MWVGVIVGVILFIVLALIVIFAISGGVADYVDNTISTFLVTSADSFSPGIPRNFYTCTLKFGGVL